MLENLIAYAVALFLFQPLNVLIHEYGHAFFVKIFGGRVTNIEVGIGEPLFRVGHVQVNKQFFIFGMCRYEGTPEISKSRLKLSFIAVGGVLFNAVTITMLILVKVYTDHNHFLDGYYFGATGMLILSALLPVTYSTGFHSDGKRLVNIWKKDSLSA
ncbi:conserved membrane hypothetical protein [Bacillus sp. 349Y]|nr:conserved membrane hypothetical protein [Bacillus sp. 349Y]